MNREKYLEKAKNILINKNSYGNYHQQNFTTYGYLGENCR